MTKLEDYINDYNAFSAKIVKKQANSWRTVEKFGIAAYVLSVLSSSTVPPERKLSLLKSFHDKAWEIGAERFGEIITEEVEAFTAKIEAERERNRAGIARKDAALRALADDPAVPAWIQTLARAALYAGQDPNCHTEAEVEAALGARPTIQVYTVDRKKFDEAGGAQGVADFALDELIERGILRKPTTN